MESLQPCQIHEVDIIDPGTAQQMYTQEAIASEGTTVTVSTAEKNIPYEGADYQLMGGSSCWTGWCSCASASRRGKRPVKVNGG